MPEPYAETLATVAAGRTALVARLRTIVARVDALPLESGAEVLMLLESAVAACEPPPRGHRRPPGRPPRQTAHDGDDARADAHAGCADQALPYPGVSAHTASDPSRRPRIPSCAASDSKTLRSFG